jgi:hypothetical protein
VEERARKGKEGQGRARKGKEGRMTSAVDAGHPHHAHTRSV